MIGLSLEMGGKRHRLKEVGALMGGNDCVKGKRKKGK